MLLKIECFHKFRYKIYISINIYKIYTTSNVYNIHVIINLELDVTLLYTIICQVIVYFVILFPPHNNWHKDHMRDKYVVRAHLVCKIELKFTEFNFVLSCVLYGTCLDLTN